MLEEVYFIDHREVSDKGAVDVHSEVIGVFYKSRKSPCVVDRYAVVFDLFILAVDEKDTCISDSLVDRESSIVCDE